MKLEGRKGNAAAAAMVRSVSAIATGRNRSWTKPMPRCCQAFMVRIQAKSAWASREFSINAESAGRLVSATPSEASTARMKASAKGPTNLPCTLVENSSGRNTAMTTKVA